MRRRRRQQPDRRRAPGRTALDAACLAAVTVPLLGFSLAGATPDRDRPTRSAEAARLSPQAADVYAFVSPDRPDTVTLISTWLSPAEESEQHGKGAAHHDTPRLFTAGAHYDINIDNDGDGAADRTYRWTFDDAAVPGTPLGAAAAAFTQRYTLEQLGADTPATTLVREGRTAPAEPARPSTSDYLGLREQALVYLPGGARAFAGQADDPSFQNLASLASTGAAEADTSTGRHSRQDRRDRRGGDLRAGHNVNVLALQVPKYWLARDVDLAANPVIGVWSSAEVAAPPASGGGSPRWTQVSRVGNPLVSELLPAGLRDTLRSQQPREDPSVRALSQALAAPVLPPLLRQHAPQAIPRGARDDLVEIYLTGISDRTDGPLRTPLNSQLMNAATRPERFVRSEQLRLNLSVPPAGHPNRLGLPAGDHQGYPNGRRLGDDVVDIQLQFLAGAARTGRLVEEVRAGDRIDANDVAFGQRFPYVALPHPRAVQGVPTAPQNTTPADDATRAETSYAPLVLALFGSAGLVLTSIAGWMLHRLRRSEQDRPNPSERQW